MLYKIIAIAVITIITSSLLKQYKSDFATLINICGGLIISIIVLKEFAGLFDNFIFISQSSNISSEIIVSIVKIIVAGYITEFCADIAEDSGNKFVASKVIIGGKVAICIMAFPILKTLLQAIISLI